MKKNIIFVNPDMFVGGIEVSLANILKNFDYSKYNVWLLILSNNLELIDRIPPEVNKLLLNKYNNDYIGKKIFLHIRQLYAKKRNIIQKILLRILRYIENKMFKKYIRKKTRKLKFDVSIAYKIGIAADIAFNDIKAKKKIIFCHYSVNKIKKSDEKIYKKADYVCAVSEGILNEVKKQYPLICFEEKGKVIHNFIDLVYIDKCKKDAIENTLSGKISIVSVGRVVFEKGFDLLVYAFNKLICEGYDCELTIVGGADNERFDEKLNSIVNELKLLDRVHFAGSQKNPYKYMKNTDIYVQCARQEAYGITIREAQYLNLPVISTKTHGGNELIINELTGLLCDISIQGLYESIKRLIDDRSLMNKLKNNCKLIDIDNENKLILSKIYELL